MLVLPLERGHQQEGKAQLGHFPQPLIPDGPGYPAYNGQTSKRRPSNETHAHEVLYSTIRIVVTCSEGT